MRRLLRGLGSRAVGTCLALAFWPLCVAGSEVEALEPLGGTEPCISACRNSGCGTDVGGGCLHLCGKPASRSADTAKIGRYREAAGERTLAKVTRRADVIGIARVVGTAERRPDDSRVELEFLEPWQPDGPGEATVRISSSSHCDIVWRPSREGQLAIVFLEKASRGEYRIAGGGWGRFDIDDSAPGALATGHLPPPVAVEPAAAEEQRRLGRWQMPVQELRDRVESLLANGR